MTLRIRSLALLAGVSVLATACHKKKPETTPTPTTSTPTTPPPREPAPPPVSTNNTPVNNGPTDAERAAAIAAIKNSLTATIYFDYDKSELLPDAQRLLNEKATILKANPAVRIRIVGNTDERGSDEYNLALGQRRAASAKTFLINSGIADNRIDVVSVGESKPAMSGEGESTWSRNRRDEFEIVAGADQIRAPGR